MSTDYKAVAAARWQAEAAEQARRYEEAQARLRDPAAAAARDLAARKESIRRKLTNIRVLLDELDEVIEAAGTGLEARSVLHHLQVADRELDAAVGRAAQTGGLVEAGG